MDSIRSLMAFLNDNGGTFLVLFTAVVAYATWKYARLTEQLVKETSFMRVAETEPFLSVYLIPEERWVNLIDIVIRNFGHAPAHDIKWRIIAENDETKARYERLYDLALFEGLSYLPPGEQFRSYVGSAVDLLKEPTAGRITIVAAYKTPKGEAREASFTLDINQYRNLSGHTPPEYDIADSLKKLSKDFERATSAFMNSLR